MTMEQVHSRSQGSRCQAAIEKEVEKADLTPFASGMIAGTMLGLATVALGNLSIGLGTAGGLLIVGISIGWLGSIMPTFGRLPAR